MDPATLVHLLDHSPLDHHDPDPRLVLEVRIHSVSVPLLLGGRARVHLVLDLHWQDKLTGGRIIC